MDRFGLPDEKCLVFTALNHALACQMKIISQVPDAGGQVRIMAVDFVLDESADDSSSSSSPSSSLAPRRYYLVFFAAKYNPNAMIFWRLTGTGISSRLAESMHKHLDKMTDAGDGLLQTNPDLSRSLVDAEANNTVQCRIVGLLQRATKNKEIASRIASTDVFLYPTGMAAIYNTNKLLRAWRTGETVVFGFPYELTLKMMQDYGFQCKFYGFGTPDELDDFEAYLASERAQQRSIQSVWCEAASNPLLRTVDLPRIRRLADEYGFVIIVDETIGSFANVDLAGVADILVTSLTKSFSGKANVMAGSVVLVPTMPYYSQLTERMPQVYVNELFGADARVLERNSRDFLSTASTMNQNAQRLVTALAHFVNLPSSVLTHVYYPSTCWSRANYEGLMRHPTTDFSPGYGGLFTLEFETVIAAATFFDALNVHKGPSLGASVTLAQPYVQTVFMREKEWAASYGLKESIVRISVGLEDGQALEREFLRALRVASRFKAGRELKEHREHCF